MDRETHRAIQEWVRTEGGKESVKRERQKWHVIHVHKTCRAQPKIKSPEKTRTIESIVIQLPDVSGKKVDLKVRRAKKEKDAEENDKINTHYPPKIYRIHDLAEFLGSLFRKKQIRENGFGKTLRPDIRINHRSPSVVSD